MVDGLTRVSVASAEKKYHDGNCGDRDLEEAAHLKRVVGVSFGRNSTDVLFEWPAKNFVLMDSDCLARGSHCRPENFHFKFASRLKHCAFLYFSCCRWNIYLFIGRARKNGKGKSRAKALHYIRKKSGRDGGDGTTLSISGFVKQTLKP